MTAGAGQRKASWIQGISLLLPITMPIMGALFVAPVIPKMMAQFHGLPHAAVLVGVAVTVPSLCMALFSTLSGALGDRFGRRRLLIGAMLLYSLVGILPFFLNDLFLIIVTRFGLGIIESMVIVLTTTMIGDHFDGEQRDRWLAGQTAVGAIAAVAMLAVAGFVGRNDWHDVFLLYLLPLFYLVLILAFTWEPAPPEHIPSQARWADLPWSGIIPICLLTLFVSVLFYVVQIQLSTALTALGVVLPDGQPDSARVGELTAVAIAVMPVGTVCFIVLSPRLRLPTLFTLEFLLLGVGFVLMSHTPSVAGFVAAAALNQLAAAMLLPTLLTWAMRQLAFAERGRGIGLWQAALAFGQFLSAVVAVPVLRAAVGGPLIPVFQLFGGASIIAALLTIVFWGGRRIVQTAPTC
jgi:MFS family permease